MTAITTTTTMIMHAPKAVSALFELLVLLHVAEPSYSVALEPLWLDGHGCIPCSERQTPLSSVSVNIGTSIVPIY